MFSRMVPTVISSNHQHKFLVAKRQHCARVSILGASSGVGSQLALLLKQNAKVEELKLHDYSKRVRGLADELDLLPCGPRVTGYVGDNEIQRAITGSHLVLMLAGAFCPKCLSLDNKMKQNLAYIKSLCSAVVATNPEVMIGMCTCPLNRIVPFTYKLLKNENAFRDYKVYGITHIDVARSKVLLGSVLQVSPRDIQDICLPVIGGHSENTIVPVFSNIYPSFYSVSCFAAEQLTKLVRTSDTDVLINNEGRESAASGLAWTVNEFAERAISAFMGQEQIVYCYKRDRMYGTKFFASPTTIGRKGAIVRNDMLHLNQMEKNLVFRAIPYINEDVKMGEKYADYISK